MLQICRLH